MNEKKNKIRRMASWTIAIFGGILAVTFAVLWLPIYPQSSNPIAAISHVFASGWLILVLDLVLCGGVYYGYRIVLGSRK